MIIKAFAPATIANFIVGFDTLGAALATIDGSLLGDIVTLEESRQNRLDFSGPYAQQLPTNADKNIIAACREFFHRALAQKNQPQKKCRLHLEKCLPIGSGLGSSATSIVATLLALNQFHENIFTKEQLLALAGKLEGKISGAIHYDNVAPSLLGGLQLILPENREQPAQRLPFFADWVFIIYYPGITVSTRRAREILPKNFAREKTISYWQKLAGFIHGLHQDDKQLVAAMLQDDLIEPRRSKLVPGFRQASAAAMAAGAIAFSLSGSGSTCFAISPSLTQALPIQAAIEAAMADDAQTGAFSRICRLDAQGARLLD